MKRYRKNSKRNPWRNTMAEREIPWHRMLAASLIITIPVMVLCLTDTVITRMPAVYSYNLQSTEILSDLTTAVDEEGLVEMVSGFMQMKTDTFQLREDVEYEPRKLFSPLDQTLMENIRHAENILGVAGILTMLWNVFVYVFLIRRGDRERVFGAFMKSIRVFAAMSLLLLLAKVIEPVQHLILNTLAGRTLPDGDILYQIFGSTLLRHVGVITFAVAVIAMILLYALTGTVAGRKRIFKKY